MNEQRTGRTESAASVREAALAMLHHGAGYLPVVDDGRLVGVVSVRDLWQHLSRSAAHPDDTATRPRRPLEPASDPVPGSRRVADRAGGEPAGPQAG